MMTEEYSIKRNRPLRLQRRVLSDGEMDSFGALPIHLYFPTERVLVSDVEIWTGSTPNVI